MAGGDTGSGTGTLVADERTLRILLPGWGESMPLSDDEDEDDDGAEPATSTGWACWRHLGCTGGVCTDGAWRANWLAMEGETAPGLVPVRSGPPK